MIIGVLCVLWVVIHIVDVLLLQVMNERSTAWGGLFMMEMVVVIGIITIIFIIGIDMNIIIAIASWTR